MQDTNPATGTTVWRTGLPGAVMGTPTLDGVGVLAVPTMPRQSGDISAVYLLAESNGQILDTISTGNTPVFSQPICRRLSVCSLRRRGLTAYKPVPG